MSASNSFRIRDGGLRLLIISALCLLACALNDTSSNASHEIDGDTDSEDILDKLKGESMCSNHTYNKTCCNENEFQCADGYCIPSEKLCDDRMDCPDQSDEVQCLSVPCSSRIHLKCDQSCTDLPRNKSRCSCYKGYALNQGKMQCQDINECLIGVHWCSQDCENLNGTFACKCKEGFEKVNDGLSGICKANDQNIQVLYSSDSWIYSYSVERHKVTPVVHSGKVDEMDIDPLTKMVYWSTRHRVGRSFLPGAKDGKVTIGHPQGLGPFSIWHIKNSLAIDWTAKNLYWISVDILNVNKYQILLSKLDGRYVKTVIDDVMYASSLVVDPEHGKMYWTTGGSDAHIGSAWMNGMYRRPLVSIGNGSSPTALTLDHMGGGRLYWADTKTHSIYSVLSDGNRANKIVTLSAGQMPLMMDVFENNLYWVTSETKQLLKYDKFGRSRPIPLVEHLINQTAIKIFHPRRVDVHIRQAQLYCRNQCSHLCIHVPKGYSCSCPDGSRLLLQMGEMLCNTEQEDEMEEPLICDCTDKEKLCNRNAAEHICHCPNVKCENGEKLPTTDSDYLELEDITVPSEMDLYSDIEFGDPYYRNNFSWKKLGIGMLVFIVIASPIFICCGLSFFKRPEKPSRSEQENARVIGFSYEDESEQGYAQGGATIIKGGAVIPQTNNGVDNPFFQDDEGTSDFMSSTQQLVP